MGDGNVRVAHSRVLEYSTMIQEELKELCNAARARDWGGSLLELTDILYLASNLVQEASLDMVLSAAFSLKHATNARKTFANQQEAQECASQLLPKKELLRRITPSGRFTIHIGGKLIKPSDFKQPNAEALVQVIRAEQALLTSPQGLKQNSSKSLQ